VAEGMAPKRISITAGAEATRGQGSDRFHVAKTILINRRCVASHRNIALRRRAL
jgi:predicted secreted protein